MSVKYNDKNNVLRDISGLTPGGDLAYGASTTRSGTVTFTNVPAGSGSSPIQVTFSDPMPDADYELSYFTEDQGTGMLYYQIFDKKATGFKIICCNNFNQALNVTLTYKAFKLYEVEHAEQNASDITTIKSYIPATTTSSNKLVNSSELDSAISGVEIDTLGEINDVTLQSLQNGQTLVWSTADQEWKNGQGGKTYTAGDGIAINSNDEISTDDDLLPFTFVGTTAQWNAVTDKSKYKLVNLTDDADYVGNIVDSVTDGEMSAVTSNAVYDAVGAVNNKLLKLVESGTFQSINGTKTVNATTDLMKSLLVIRLYDSSGDIYSYSLGYAITTANNQPTSSNIPGLVDVTSAAFSFKWDATFTWWYGIYQLNCL